MRELVLDTETTGMDHVRDRLVSLGIVELIDGKFANEWEWFFNPGIPCSPSAYQVHRIPDWWLAERHDFRAHAAEIRSILGEDMIVAHNSKFDMFYLNKEFRLLAGKKTLTAEELNPYPESRWIDTVKIARKMYPRQGNKLDDLADRYGIYRGHRIKHGALKDARILVEVYNKLRRGESYDLLADVEAGSKRGIVQTTPEIDYENRPPMKNHLTSAEKRTHAKLVEEFIGPKAIWYDYLPVPKKLKAERDKINGEAGSQG